MERHAQPLAKRLRQIGAKSLGDTTLADVAQRNAHAIILTVAYLLHSGRRSAASHCHCGDSGDTANPLIGRAGAGFAGYSHPMPKQCEEQFASHAAKSDLP